MDLQNQSDDNKQKSPTIKPTSINYMRNSIKSRKSNESNYSIGMIGSIQFKPYPQKMSLQSDISQKAKRIMLEQDLFEKMANQGNQQQNYDFRNRGSINQYKVAQQHGRASQTHKYNQIKIQAPNRISLQEEQPLEQKQINCKCSKSKCLLMYCQCFSKGMVCKESCSCYQCRNNHDFQQKREKARKSVLQKNPNAFDNKLEMVGGQSNVNLAYKKGCNCKKTLCFKKYCECFYAGVKCTYLCNCQNCMNGGQNAYKQ